MLRRCASTARTWGAVTVRLTMRLGAAGKMITLYSASKAFTLGDASHVNNFTILEDVGLNDVTEVILGVAIVRTHLAQTAHGGCARLLNVTLLTCGQLAFWNFFKTQLDGIIAIGFDR